MFAKTTNTHVWVTYLRAPYLTTKNYTVRVPYTDPKDIAKNAPRDEYSFSMKIEKEEVALDMCGKVQDKVPVSSDESGRYFIDGEVYLDFTDGSQRVLCRNGIWESFNPERDKIISTR